jgi:anti-sigma regulatory factor (Ser/Thr protein kinase)
LIPCFLQELAQFTSPGWEQDDDITLVTLQQLGPVSVARGDTAGVGEETSAGATRVLLTLSVPSAPGNEREATNHVAKAVSGLTVPTNQLERLKTAVAEATMNAMEHGNEYRADLPVTIQVRLDRSNLVVSITDHGEKAIQTTDLPDLDAKLEGLQTPRGWGLFLIRSLVDDMHTISDESHHTVELVFHLK